MSRGDFGRLLAVAGVIACEDAGIPTDLASQLVWRTPPRDSGVSVHSWRRAREVLAAELVHHGWDTGAVAQTMGADEGWVAETVAVKADRFESQDFALSLDM